MNGDGVTSPLDALMLSNMANSHGFGDLSDDIDDRYDLNGDQRFTPIDFLLVVNQLNDQSQATVEQIDYVRSPLAASFSVAAAFDDVDDDQDENESSIDAAFALWP